MNPTTAILIGPETLNSECMVIISKATIVYFYTSAGHLQPFDERLYMRMHIMDTWQYTVFNATYKRMPNTNDTGVSTKHLIMRWLVQN